MRRTKLIFALLLFLLFSGHSSIFASEGGEGKKAEGEAEKGALGPRRDHKFWQSWVPMLGFDALRLQGGVDTKRIDPTEGRMLIVVFLASWCVPCQQLMPDIIRLEKRYQALNTDVVYVFAHDTREDAESFIKEFKLQNGYLASMDVFKIFHNPELPTIYVGDRRKWLAARYVKATKEDVAKLDELAKYLTAF